MLGYANSDGNLTAFHSVKAGYFIVKFTTAGLPSVVWTGKTNAEINDIVGPDNYGNMFFVGSSRETTITVDSFTKTNPSGKTTAFIARMPAYSVMVDNVVWLGDGVNEVRTSRVTVHQNDELFFAGTSK